METLSVGKMDNMSLLEPKSRLPIFTHINVSDVRLKFVSHIKTSARKLYKQLKLTGNNKRPGEFDMLNFSLSNNEISISSLVTFSSPQTMEVLVHTDEPISFEINHFTFRRLLYVMSIGKEIDEIVLAYEPGENKLILVDTRSETYFRTVPCIRKEINESLLHLELNN